jgi:hypothetical protein
MNLAPGRLWVRTLNPGGKLRILTTGWILLGLAACSTDRRLLAPDPNADMVSPEKRDQWEKTTEEPISPTPPELGRSQGIWQAWYVQWRHYYGWEELKRHHVLDTPEYFPGDAGLPVQ